MIRQWFKETPRQAMMDGNIAQTNTRWDRIGREVSNIRSSGYECTLQQHGDLAYVSVHVNRETNDGQQPVMIYMQLDLAFPERRPEMVVTILAAPEKDSSEIGEWELEIDSSTRLSWQPESSLRDIVMDIERGVHTEHLALAEAAQSSSSIYQHSALLEPYQEHENGQPIEELPARRVGGPIVPAIVGAILMLAFASVGYLLFFRDTCATDWRQAQAGLSSSNSAIVHQAAQAIESLSQRAQAGERGSCRLAAAPAVLHDAYLRAGKAALEAKNAEQARDDFTKALTYLPESAEAQAGQQAAIAMQVKPAWDEANRLSGATPVDWQNLIANLKSIFDIDAKAINPSDDVTVTRQLYLAYVGWGDELYQQDQLDQARDRYTLAQGFFQGDGRASQSRDWVDLKRSVRAINLTAQEWSGILDRLKQFTQAWPGARDPAGQTIDPLLYTAYVHYGQALLDRHGTDAALARDQAQAALALSDMPDDKGQAARELLAAAEQALASAGERLVFEVKRLEAADWNVQLRKYNLSKARLGKPLNLIVVSPDTTITLTITLPSADGTRLLTASNGVFADAVDGGNAILKYTKGDQFDEASLNFSAGATYLVTLVPQATL